MMQLLSYIISAICISISIMHIYYNLVKPVKIYKIRIFYTLLFSMLVFLTTYIYAAPFLRQIIIMILLFLMSFIGYKTNVKNSAINMIYLELLCVVSEILYGTIFLLFNQANVMEWNHSVAGSILANTIIPIIMLLLNKTKIFKGIYNKLAMFTNYLSNNNVLFVTIFFFITVVILFYSVYYVYYSNKVILFISISLTFLLYTIIILIALKTSHRYQNIKSKYGISLENLKLYENMLDQYRISNHENKNQLLLIRNMVKDNKTKNYIDELIDNKEKDDSNVYNKLKRIPSSTIRAVIYSKVLLMNNKNISYSIDIDRKLTSKDFAYMSSNLLLDICNILNIFIDNAIDEVSKSTKKQILVEFVENEDNIEIAISNTCESVVKLDEIYGMGYSTKGDEHGYGLPIVKNILDNRINELSNETEYVNNIFSQYLYIKKKKM